MEESLRLGSGVKKIEVNDAGECIYVSMNDNSFFQRFGNFINWLEERKAHLPEKDNKESVTGMEATAKAVEVQANLCRDVCAELDKLFGEGCMKKVFPEVECPDMLLISDFIEAMIPILEKFAQERNEKVNSKYNRNRKGARSRI